MRLFENVNRANCSDTCEHKFEVTTSLPYLFEKVLYVQVVGEQLARVDKPLLVDSLQRTNTSGLWLNSTGRHLHGGEASQRGNEKPSAFTWQLVTVILSDETSHFQVIPSKSLSSHWTITLNPDVSPDFQEGVRKAMTKPIWCHAAWLLSCHALYRERKN